MKNQVSFNIEYAGLILLVFRTQECADVVALKPLSDLFGLRWKTQQRRLAAPYVSEFLGVCTPSRGGAGGQNREQICIRIDRVAAYLMGINPAMVHAKGNADGAAFLRQKQAEWADALHEYESMGIAINPNHKDVLDGQRRLCASLCQMIGVYNKTEKGEHRRALDVQIARVSGELGAPYQPDLLDGQGA